MEELGIGDLREEKERIVFREERERKLFFERRRERESFFERRRRRDVYDVSPSSIDDYVLKPTMCVLKKVWSLYLILTILFLSFNMFNKASVQCFMFRDD